MPSAGPKKPVGSITSATYRTTPPARLRGCPGSEQQLGKLHARAAKRDAMKAGPVLLCAALHKALQVVEGGAVASRSYQAKRYLRSVREHHVPDTLLQCKSLCKAHSAVSSSQLPSEASGKVHAIKQAAAAVQKHRNQAHTNSFDAQ